MFVSCLNSVINYLELITTCSYSPANNGFDLNPKIACHPLASPILMERQFRQPEVSFPTSKEILMKKFECTYQKRPTSGYYLFTVILIADAEVQAKQMASAHAHRTSGWPSLDTGDWYVSQLDTGYNSPARVLDYSKR